MCCFSAVDSAHLLLGVASYHSARMNGEVVEDIVWYYPEPLSEAGKVKDHLCFYDEKVDFEVEG